MLMDGGEGKMFKKNVLLRILSIRRGKEKKMTEQQRMKEFAHLCIKLDQSKLLRRKGGSLPCV